MGQGLYHQGGAGGGRGVRHRPRPREDHRDDHRQGAEHLADRRLVRHRSQRHGGARRRPRRSRRGWSTSPPKQWNVAADRVSVSTTARCSIGNQRIAFAELGEEGLSGARLAVVDRLLRDAEDHWDRAKAKGRPFFYFAYGAACSEVTDRHADRRDAGRPRRHPPRRRPLAQSGDRHRPDRGRLRAGHGLADHRGAGVRRARAGCAPTRRRPTRSRRASDVPADFRVALYESGGNREDTIYRSKAVGEPPLMLAISVFSAITDAIAQPRSRQRCRRSTRRRRRRRSCGRSTR